MHGLLNRLVSGLVLCGLALAAGCATSGPDDTAMVDAAVVPADFTLDLQIDVGTDVGPQSQVQLRPLRIVLAPDGTLRAGETNPAHPDSLPGLTRRIDRKAVAAVWNATAPVLRDDANEGDADLGRHDLVVPSNRVVQRLTVTGLGRRWSLVRTVDPTAPAPGDEAATEFIRRLARLAWMPDGPERRVLVQPKRYDFGPDPYARFRSP